MSDDEVTRVAIKLRDRAKTFRDPVHYYVRDEARDEWQEANPDKDPVHDCPDTDWELEGWKLLAVAAIEGLKETSQVSVRDQYHFDIRCQSCGKTGRIDMSEWNRPTVESGTGRRIDALSEGFRRAAGAGDEGFPKVFCATCKVEIPY